MVVRGRWSLPVTIRKTLRYEPAADLWTAMAGMRKGRRQHAAVVLNGALHVIGGVGGLGDELLASAERYDEDNDVVEEIPGLETPRGGLAAAVLHIEDHR